MKSFIVALVVLVVGGAGFFVGRYEGRFAASKVPSPKEAPPPEMLSVDTKHTILLLVDAGGIYCAGEKLPSEGVEEYVKQTLLSNKALHVAVCATPNVPFGDVVALLGKLRKKGISVRTLITRPITANVRLPLLESQMYDVDY